MNRLFRTALTIFLGVTPSVFGFDYLDVPKGNVLLQHLVNHTYALQAEVDQTRANKFLMIPPVIEQVQVQRGWGAAFYTRVLIDPNRRLTPDQMVGKLVNDFRMEAIQLYDQWWMTKTCPNPILTQKFVRTDYAYMNAISAVYFYIEALRRSYLIQNAVGPVKFFPSYAAFAFDQAVLRGRLIKLERLAMELRELMYVIRYGRPFQFPLKRICVESTYRSFQMNLTADAAQPFIPFPFYAENRVWAPDNQALNPISVPNQGNLGAPLYNSQFWDQRWNQMEQGYLQGYPFPQQPGQGGQPGGQRPGNFEQRPFTPVPNQGLGGGGLGGGVPGYPPLQGGQQIPQQQQPGFPVQGLGPQQQGPIQGPFQQGPQQQAPYYQPERQQQVPQIPQGGQFPQQQQQQQQPQGGGDLGPQRDYEYNT